MQRRIPVKKALLIRPAHTVGNVLGVVEWNQRELWKRCYEKVNLSKVVFFAENIIGEQFGVKGKKIYLFEPETGEFELVAKNIEGWADLILKEAEDRTLWPLARAWQDDNDELPDGKRLMPTIPFVTGGEYDPSNLFAAPDYERMRFGGQLATQIAGVPNGAKIKFTIS